MEMQQRVKTIAILGVDGDNYEVGGVYVGEERKPSWYTLTKSDDRSVRFEKLDAFPSHEQIREMIH
ncbi:MULTISPECIES: hypothetical protein [Marinobacterium]|uniref:Uncharacterized protein n=2 Tax=Marinobacterium TaxID=48075 RepID=A0A1H6C7X6_9GAMM|nr:MULTISPECIES: hypothetical protein [Marinobacterium]TCK04103.1 hypothetical protein CLV83_3518 [Marinobacterium mangrovicola]SEG69008.1 hypothetical protein SAMN05444390_103260 [Marinobacterium lutimaris]